MRDTTLVNKLVFPNIKRLATQPSISIQRSLLIKRLYAFRPPAKGEYHYTHQGLKEKGAGVVFYSAFSAACPL